MAARALLAQGAGFSPPCPLSGTVSSLILTDGWSLWVSQTRVGITHRLEPIPQDTPVSHPSVHVPSLRTPFSGGSGNINQLSSVFGTTLGCQHCCQELSCSFLGHWNKLGLKLHYRGSGWIPGKYSWLEEWLSTGMGCPGQGWSHLTGSVQKVDAALWDVVWRLNLKVLFILNDSVALGDKHHTEGSFQNFPLTLSFMTFSTFPISQYFHIRVVLFVSLPSLPGSILLNAWPNSWWNKFCVYLFCCWNIAQKSFVCPQTSDKSLFLLK